MSTGLVTVDNNKLLNQIDVLSQAFSVAQHHDAVAGTLPTITKNKNVTSKSYS